MPGAIVQTLTANGVSGWFQPTPGAGVRISAQGNFGGGTLTYERSYDGGTTAVTQTGGGSAYPAFTAPSDEMVDACELPGMLVRVRLDGATNPNLPIRLGHY